MLARFARSGSQSHPPLKILDPPLGFNDFDAIPALDGQTNGRTEGRRTPCMYRAMIRVVCKPVECNHAQQCVCLPAQGFLLVF